MKKLFTTLISLTALLLLCSLPVNAALPPQVSEDGTVFTDDGKNLKITKVADGEYIVEAINTDQSVTFDNLPDGTAERAFMSSFKAGTKITLKGEFSSYQAMQNTLRQWKEVNLKDMKINSTPTIKEYFGQNSVEKVVLSNYPTSISKDAFSDLGNLKELTIGARMESIPYEFFSGKTTLQKLSFNTITENGVTYGTKTIGNKAFNGCTALATVEWPSTLEEIGTDATDESIGAFQNTALSGELDLSGTKVKTIGKEAFDGCSSITSVKFNNNTLEVIAGEAFHGTGLTSVNLTNASKLRKLGFEAFEECSNLTTFDFPAGNTLTVIGNDCFRKSGITTIDMSMCEGLQYFTPKANDGAYRTFSECTSLTSVILPPDLREVPGESTNALFAGCTSLTTITFTGEAIVKKGVDGKPLLDENNHEILDNPLIISKMAFYGLRSLTTVTFSSNLKEVKEQAFYQTSLTEVDLSGCHHLTLLDKQSFAEISPLASVKLCSHPKVIKGDSQNGSEGPGAFFHCTNIRTVEVVGCDNTDMTECICENRAFDVNITYGQTATINVEHCAVLIYPKNGFINANSKYTSSFDYFVGDYKAGALMTQEALLAYYRDVPLRGAQDTKVEIWDDKKQQYVDKWFNVKCDYQKGNGWHEFLNLDQGEIIPEGEFLRTYSRTAGDGPCILVENLITAYRAVDYTTDQFAWLLNKREGNYVCINESKAENTRTDADYILLAVIKDMTDEAIAAQYPNFFSEQYPTVKSHPRYTHATIGGKLYLRPLRPKQAYYLKDGVKYEGYADNQAFFDGLMVNDNPDDLTNPQRITSYVPENTGVVLYSTGTNEDAFLMLPGYNGDDLVLTEYEHTGARYEGGRLTSDDKRDNINMLHGTFGDGWPVAPVFPWNYKNETDCSGGHYGNPKAYRNFACVKTGTTGGSGGLAVRNKYGWKRLQPSKMIVNRAFAQIPEGRFTNFNEANDPSQYPGFTIQDTTDENPSVDSEGTQTSSSNSLMLISIFEDETAGGAVVDGIEEIKTADSTMGKSEDNAWYTLQGVKVSNLTKGIYIHNGKKVVIK